MSHCHLSPPAQQLRPNRRSGIRGFTLTEMLVVVGIILLVMTMILTGAVAARKAARQTMCLTQLRSIGLGVTNYATRYDQALPLGSWADVAPGGGMPSESPLSVRGFGTVRGDPASVYGPGAGPLPTIRDALRSFMNTKEAVWKCPLQQDAKGAVLLPFAGAGWADDDRGFRPGYRFMCTLDMRPFVRSAEQGERELGKKLRAEEMLVRNVAGLKNNRIKALDNGGPSAVVLAYDASVTFHSKETRELYELPPGDRAEMRLNVLYLDGHAEEKTFKGRDGFMGLFHGPVKQKWYGADFAAEFPDSFIHPARRESEP